MENTKIFIEPGIFFTLPESQIGPDGQNFRIYSKIFAIYTYNRINALTKRTENQRPD